MTDFRALCVELIESVEVLLALRPVEARPLQTTEDRLSRARAALAKPADAPAAVAERPSDEELRDLWSWAAGQDQGPWPTQYHCFARAVLARWNNPAPQPLSEGEPSDEELLRAAAFAIEPHHIRWITPAPAPAGEVAELVAWLREQAHHELGSTFDADYFSEDPAARNLNRAAELLQRLSPPQPVPVSERLPDPSNSAECRMPDGLCWWFDPHEDGAWYFDSFQGNYTHWLPAYALPLPGQEVEG